METDKTASILLLNILLVRIPIEDFVYICSADQFSPKAFRCINSKKCSFVIVHIIHICFMEIKKDMVSKPLSCFSIGRKDNIGFSCDDTLNLV